jgi:hypothetical protein
VNLEDSFDREPQRRDRSWFRSPWRGTAMGDGSLFQERDEERESAVSVVGFVHSYRTEPPSAAHRQSAFRGSGTRQKERELTGSSLVRFVHSYRTGVGPPSGRSTAKRGSEGIIGTNLLFSRLQNETTQRELGGSTKPWLYSQRSNGNGPRESVRQIFRV